jgi:tRNA A37 methylthiotransferase MiaB
MDIQADVMDGFAESFLGRELEVLCMGVEDDGTPWGRSQYDSPDIDSRVVFSGSAAPGDMVNVKITAVDEGELIGEQIGD